MANVITHVPLSTDHVEVDLPTGATIRGVAHDNGNIILFMEYDTTEETTETRTFEVYQAQEELNAEATVYIGTVLDSYLDRFEHVYELVAAP